MVGRFLRRFLGVFGDANGVRVFGDGCISVCSGAGSHSCHSVVHSRGVWGSAGESIMGTLAIASDVFSDRCIEDG